MLPPVKNFEPGVSNSENQNWAFAQGDNGTIFIANNSGLLTYNGAQWRLYSSPNNSIVRSVGYGNGKVYTGSHMELGYWEQDTKGFYQYASLVDKLPGKPVEDEEFWKILFVGQSVLFQSLDRICIFDTLKQTFSTINVNQELTKAYKVEGVLYFQVAGKGLYQVVNGKANLLISNQIVSNDVIIEVFKNNRELIVLTQANGLFKLVDGLMVPWQVEANTIIKDSQAFTFRKLNNGNFAIGTITSGLLICDNGGKIVMHIDQANGLLNNTVLSLFEDRDNNIWLGLDYGISVVNMDTPFKVYRDTAGKLGTVYAAASQNGFLYLGTNQGLFYRSEADNDSDFKLISGTSGQVWQLKILYNTLFCGHNTGTLVVDGDSAKRVSAIPGTWDLQKVPGDSTLILQGNYNGLSLLQKDDGQWRMRNKLGGYDISSRYFAWSDTNEILVSHEYKGVFKLRVNDLITEVEKYDILKTAPAGSKSSVSTFDGKVVYGHPKGISTYDENTGNFQIDSTLSTVWDENRFISGKLIPGEDGSTLWVFNKDGLILFYPDDLTSRVKQRSIPFPASVRRDMQGYENISALNENSFLIGLAGGFVVLRTDELRDRNYEVHLNRIQNSGRGLEPYYLSLDTTVVEFASTSNTLGFRYHVSEYEKYNTVNYQYRLKGRSDVWSSWRNTPAVIFENLPFGEYFFEIRAKVGNSVTVNTESFAFSIARPWYISILAIIIYSLMLLIILLSIYAFTRRYYERRQQKLIEKNKTELEMHRNANERELLKVRNEKLQSDFDSKSRELAASAMSIVKKNELLGTIKKELAAASKDNHVSRVIKILDKNLNTNKDWEFFEEAFNNADKDFLQNMKSLHPKLTPNDLKLCAYLRLNLSSKEIAPLLNISVRSVEIKRYRLRKKMALEHEQSLVEYILSV
ncbi:MAG: triple tyrosine motif-containing protein [Leeuwenhoekiella sp.]